MNILDSKLPQIVQSHKSERFFIFFIFWAVFILGFYQINNLYQLGFYQHINIAFDLDQAWFVDVLSRPFDSWLYREAAEHTPLLIKHPLLYMFRLPAEILQFLSISEERSAILVSLFFIALTPVILFKCLRLLDFSNINSAILSFAFIFTASFQTNMQVLDSYSIAQCWILAALFLFIKNTYTANLHNTWLKALVYVALAGTTSYLILFALLCELIFIIKQSQSYTKQRLFKYAATLLGKFTLLFSMVFAIIYFDILLILLSDPVDVLKRTLWAVARSGEKEGLWQLIETFMLYSVFSPMVSAVTIESTITMLDYRQFKFSLLGYFSVIILPFLYFLCLSKIKSPVIALSIVWLVINLSFHLIYQDRGSLFLYSGHILPVIFLALCIGMQSFKKYLPIAGVVLLLLLMLENINTDIKQSIEINQQLWESNQ